MKILIISEFFPTGKNLVYSGGVESRNFFVAKFLAKNHRLTILTSNITGTKKEETISGFKVLRVGPPRNYVASTGDFLSRSKFLKSAIEAGKELECDLVEGTNFVTHFIAKSIAISKKIPVVAWYPDVWLGSWINNAGPLGLIGDTLEKINLKRGFDAYIAISNTTAKKLKKYVATPISVIPCGVEPSEFQANGVKSKIPTIITISRLTKYKNIDKLILAFALLLLKFRSLQLTIIGTGPEEKKLKRLSKGLNLSSHIKFISNLPRQELTKTLSSARLFSLPSTVEGFGIAILEACAAGVPYVASDIEVFKEVTKNGKGGLLFQNGSPKDLAQKLEQLLSDKKLYDQKAKEAISLAKNYNWREISTETEKLYKSLIKNKTI